MKSSTKKNRYEPATYYSCTKCSMPCYAHNSVRLPKLCPCGKLADWQLFAGDVHIHGSIGTYATHIPASLTKGKTVSVDLGSLLVKTGFHEVKFKLRKK